MDAKEKAVENSAENLVNAPNYTEDFSNEWIGLHVVDLMAALGTLSKARAAVGNLPPTLMFIKDKQCLACKVMKVESRDQAETEMIACGKYANENDVELVICVFESLSRMVKKTDTIKCPEDIPFEERSETYPESMNTLALVIYLFDCTNKKAAIFKQDIIESDTGFALGEVRRFPVRNVAGNLVDNFFMGYNS